MPNKLERAVLPNSAANPLPAHQNSAVDRLHEIAPKPLIEITFSIYSRHFASTDKRFSAAGSGMRQVQLRLDFAAQGFDRAAYEA
jgi:hypothetical protein